MSILPLYRDGRLVWESSSGAARDLSQIFASYQGPTFLYDLDGIRRRFSEMSAHLQGARAFFAMKANSHFEILRLFAGLGAGADVVSGGEIRAALQAGFTAERIVYSGVGKTRGEIAEALTLGIYQLNVESAPELIRIAEIAKSLKKVAPVALRVNPNISIQTHPYIATGLKKNKFGIDLEKMTEALAILRQNKNSLSLMGISLHLGSQMQEFSGFEESLKILRPLFQSLRSEFPTVRRFDFGGGLGIRYDGDFIREESLQLARYGEIIGQQLGDLGAELQTEPGRWLVGHSGILVGEVQYVKKTSEKNFLILDTGMNHLLRPALYAAEHRILPLLEHAERPLETYEVVGPICESADFIGRGRRMHACQEGDKVAILDAGAYGASMSSTYNLQPLAREITLKSDS